MKKSACILPVFLLIFLNAIYCQLPGYSQFDLNGNQASAEWKGINTLEYNHLNLIERVVSHDKGEIRYLYDATGKRIAKIVKPANGTIITRHYIDGLEYDDAGVVALLTTEEGTAYATGGRFNYTYHLRDHLGNVRVSFMKDTSSKSTKIIQTSSYYPFGALQLSNAFTSGEPNKYLYNGKEWQNELALDLYDYGARMYDPSIARWVSPDAMCEKYAGHSPYNYVLNNPVNTIDPDGNDPVYVLSPERVYAREFINLLKTQANAGKIPAYVVAGFEKLHAEGRLMMDPNSPQSYYATGKDSYHKDGHMVIGMQNKGTEGVGVGIHEFDHYENGVGKEFEEYRNTPEDMKVAVEDDMRIEVRAFKRQAQYYLKAYESTKTEDYYSSMQLQNELSGIMGLLVPGLGITDLSVFLELPFSADAKLWYLQSDAILKGMEGPNGFRPKYLPPEFVGRTKGTPNANYYEAMIFFFKQEQQQKEQKSK